MKKALSIISAFVIAISAYGQYPPQVGLSGADAIHKDSSIIIAWASACIVNPGYIDMSDTNLTYTQGDITSNRAFFGEEGNAVGNADGKFICLGDQGIATLSFDMAIANGPGADFAVFENGFISPMGQDSLAYLELAFVEVSSDGLKYVRFPAVSKTDTSTQLSNFASLNARHIHNLAGKHLTGYGTPFDLEELKDSTGINIDSITSIRIIDVGGCITCSGASTDHTGNPINDPFPTPFWSGGFDLDAVGIINQYKKASEPLEAPTLVTKNEAKSEIYIYPNPVNTTSEIIITNTENITKISIIDSSGQFISSKNIDNKSEAQISSPSHAGVYFIRISSDGNSITKRIIVLP